MNVKEKDLHGHIEYKCPPNCDNEHCNFCRGGLFQCTRCNGAEGSLPFECPGAQMTADQADEVYARRLDFVDGQWVNLDTPGARAKNARIRRGISLEDATREGGWTPGVLEDIEAGKKDTYSPRHSTWGTLARQYHVQAGWLAGWETCTRCKNFIDPEDLYDDTAPKAARAVGQKAGRTLWNHYACWLELEIELLRGRVAEQDLALEAGDRLLSKYRNADLEKLQAVIDETKKALEPEHPETILTGNVARAVAARLKTAEILFEGIKALYLALTGEEWQKPEKLRDRLQEMVAGVVGLQEHAKENEIFRMLANRPARVQVGEALNPNGDRVLSIHHSFNIIIAEALALHLRNAGAVNYITFEITDTSEGTIRVTVRRPEGKSPEEVYAADQKTIHRALFGEEPSEHVDLKVWLEQTCRRADLYRRGWDTMWKALQLEPSLREKLPALLVRGVCRMQAHHAGHHHREKILEAHIESIHHIVENGVGDLLNALGYLDLSVEQLEGIQMAVHVPPEQEAAADPDDPHRGMNGSETAVVVTVPPNRWEEFAAVVVAAKQADLEALQAASIAAYECVGAHPLHSDLDQAPQSKEGDTP